MRKSITFQSIILLAAFVIVFCYSANGQIAKDYWINQKKAYAAKSAIECQSSLAFCNTR